LKAVIDKDHFGVIYEVECRWANGEPRWRARAVNMVPYSGANKLLDACFKGGLTSPTWYVGLIYGAGAPTFATSDTMGSHPGWTEVPSVQITQTSRQLWVPGSISVGSIDNTGSPATYQIAATYSPTIQGLFMVDNNTLGGTTGNLYSEAVFDTGAQPTSPGNILNVTATLAIIAG